MDKINLGKKPLVEAIFEIRWKLRDTDNPDVKVDPFSKVRFGRIYDRVKKDYPVPEQLPTSAMPDEIAAYVTQQRFRAKKDDWPLIQLGPGILTLNDTKQYEWDDFKNRISKILDELFDTRFDEQDLLTNGISLRYLDAILFDFEKEDVLSFLSKMMKVNLHFEDSIYDNTGVSKVPQNFEVKFSFPSTKPKGMLFVMFTRARSAQGDGLFWETTVQTVNGEIPQEKEDILQWVDDAHRLTHNWFFNMIEGELLERFK